MFNQKNRLKSEFKTGFWRKVRVHQIHFDFLKYRFFQLIHRNLYRTMNIVVFFVFFILFPPKIVSSWNEEEVNFEIIKYF